MLVVGVVKVRNNSLPDKYSVVELDNACRKKNQTNSDSFLDDECQQQSGQLLIAFNAFKLAPASASHCLVYMLKILKLKGLETPLVSQRDTQQEYRNCAAQSSIHTVSQNFQVSA